MKKILLATAVVVGFSSFVQAEEQTVHQAKNRMDALATMFRANGVNTFDILNGIGGGGSGREVSGKGRTSFSSDLSVVQSGDPRGGLYCVRDNKWVVTPEHMKLNKDASDDVLFKKAVEELRKQPSAGEVSFKVTFEDGVAKEERVVIAVRSTHLLNMPRNPTGSKFVCWTAGR